MWACGAPHAKSRNGLYTTTNRLELLTRAKHMERVPKLLADCRSHKREALWREANNLVMAFTCDCPIQRILSSAGTTHKKTPDAEFRAGVAFSICVLVFSIQAIYRISGRGIEASHRRGQNVEVSSETARRFLASSEKLRTPFSPSLMIHKSCT